MKTVKVQTKEAQTVVWPPYAETLNVGHRHLGHLRRKSSVNFEAVKSRNVCANAFHHHLDREPHHNYKTSRQWIYANLH